MMHCQNHVWGALHALLMAIEDYGDDPGDRLAALAAAYDDLSTIAKEEVDKELLAATLELQAIRSQIRLTEMAGR
jgi:hypothetical protein